MWSSTSELRRPIAGLVAVLLLLGAAGLAGAPPAAAAGEPIRISGHGWGHGRGMGQYGSLGYALAGWSSEQILEHFYSNTHPANIGGSTEIGVRLTAYDGGPRRISSNTAFSVSGITVSAGSAAWVTRDGTQWTLHTAYAPACTSTEAWSTPITDPTFIPSNPTSGPNLDQLLYVCDGAGLTTPRYYRGALRAALDGTAQRMVNVLALDEYLRGVVPQESPPSWPAAALQAQAVAARSYAMAENRYAYAKTCDTTSCQVYRGAAFGSTRFEAASTDAAILATAGGIRRMDATGAIARAEFSSSTGGFTAGGTFPAVQDDGDATPANPNHNWVRDLSAADVAARYGVGTLISVTVTARTAADGGRRAATVQIQGSAGTVSRTGTAFQGDWGLLSTYFDISVAIPAAGGYLRHTTTSGSADIIAGFGDRGDVLLLCDWDGNGTDTVGVFRSGAWYLRNGPGGGVADVPAFGYGGPGDVPLCGDWDGNGTDTVGVFRSGAWYLRNGPGGGVADVPAFAYGEASDRPVTGDWDGNGKDTVGVFRGGSWYLRNGPGGGVADVGTINYGGPGDIPVPGDWDGNGFDTVGIVRSASWYLRNGAGGGFHDIPVFSYGNPSGDRPLAADGDANGTDGPALARGY